MPFEPFFFFFNFKLLHDRDQALWVALVAWSKILFALSEWMDETKILSAPCLNTAFDKNAFPVRFSEWSYHTAQSGSKMIENRLIATTSLDVSVWPAPARCRNNSWMSATRWQGRRVGLKKLFVTGKDPPRIKKDDGWKREIIAAQFTFVFSICCIAPLHRPCL